MKIHQFVTCAFLVIVNVTGLQSAWVLKGGNLSSMAIEKKERKLRVRICNAVPSPGHSLHLSAGFIGNDEVLQYRECKEYHVGRNAMSLVRMKLSNGAETKWPGQSFDCGDCHTVFLIAYRRVLSVGLAVKEFEVKDARTPDSHPVSQIFFLDAYEGGGKSPSLILHPSFATAVRGSVASIGLEPSGEKVVEPGRYEATSQGSNVVRKAQSTLIVLKDECYVVVRVGMEGRQDGLPPKLIVFPKSDSSLLPSPTERSTVLKRSWSALPMVLTLLMLWT